MLSAADFSAPPLVEVRDPWLQPYGLRLRMLRLDQIHPQISGNKWYKLSYNLRAAQAAGQGTLLSFGGAYSNHLVALAAAGRLSGMRTIGVLRGERGQQTNPRLEFCEQQGMQLHHVSRGDYRRSRDADFIAALHAQFGDFYLIPEGGSNLQGVRGCMAIAQHLHAAGLGSNSCVALACGTAATLAGLLAGLQGECSVLGVSVLKGEDTLSAQVREWLALVGREDPCAWTLRTDFHCGGYAKNTPELTQFIHRFHSVSGITLEHVYTGKLMLALYTLIAQGQFARGSDLIALHTGGLSLPR